MVNRILAKGAQVITTALEPGIHVSGHASRDEQQRVLQTVRPRNFIPVHGELRHLKRHHALAESCGVPGLRSFVITDGEVLGFAPEGVTALGRVPVGQLMMRREGLLPIGDATLAERRALAEAGVVIAVVVLQQGGGRVLSPTTVHGQGLEAEELAALPLASAGAQLAVDELSAAVRGDDERVREALVRGVRRVFKQTLGRRPQVLPVVVRL